MYLTALLYLPVFLGNYPLPSLGLHAGEANSADKYCKFPSGEFVQGMSASFGMVALLTILLLAELCRAIVQTSESYSIRHCLSVTEVSVAELARLLLSA